MSITNQITTAATESIGIIDCDATAEDVSEVISKMDAWAEAIKNAQAMLKEALYLWLNQQKKGTQLIVGTKKYYIGSTVVKKAIDNSGALTALFESTGGDLKTVSDCISGGASAWKFAKCKQVLGDDKYAEQFVEIVKKDVKGETVKALKSVDTRFI